MDLAVLVDGLEGNKDQYWIRNSPCDGLPSRDRTLAAFTVAESGR